MNLTGQRIQNLERGQDGVSLLQPTWDKIHKATLVIYCIQEKHVLLAEELGKEAVVSVVKVPVVSPCFSVSMSLSLLPLYWFCPKAVELHSFSVGGFGT